MKAKPVHFFKPCAASPVCAGTGHFRRVRGTNDTTLTTCKRCQAVIARRSLGPVVRS
jgi:hypothetical protein